MGGKEYLECWISYPDGETPVVVDEKEAYSKPNTGIKKFIEKQAVRDLELDFDHLKFTKDDYFKHIKKQNRIIEKMLGGLTLMANKTKVWNTTHKQFVTHMTVSEMNHMAKEVLREVDNITAEGN